MLTLLSLLGGGLTRLFPEILSLFNKYTDNSHELAMIDKQIALEAAKSAAHQAEIRTQGEQDMNVANINALNEALKSQMQPTNNWLVDALNFLVRPLTTYYFLAMYGAVKVAMFMLAIKSGVSGWDAILKLYTDDDSLMLKGILGFWFVGRVFDKKQ